jgi:5-methylcytosine-specific restriction endonuclease McrA
MSQAAQASQVSKEKIKNPEPVESCKFCSETDPDALESHHIIPRRFNGSDEDDNLVTLCASCHRKIESLYDKEFFHKLKKSRDQLKCPMCGKTHRNPYQHREHVKGCFE